MQQPDRANQETEHIDGVDEVGQIADRQVAQAVRARSCVRHALINMGSTLIMNRRVETLPANAATFMTSTVGRSPGARFGQSTQSSAVAVWVFLPSPCPWIRFCWYAYAVAAARDATPILMKVLLTCRATVFSLRNSSPAMIRLVRLRPRGLCATPRLGQNATPCGLVRRVELEQERRLADLGQGRAGVAFREQDSRRRVAGGHGFEQWLCGQHRCRPPPQQVAPIWCMRVLDGSPLIDCARPSCRRESQQREPGLTAQGRTRSSKLVLRLAAPPASRLIPGTWIRNSSARCSWHRPFEATDRAEPRTSGPRPSTLEHAAGRTPGGGRRSQRRRRCRTGWRRPHRR